MYKVSSFTKNAYRVNEVAKMLGVTTKTIRNYDAEGKIKMIRTEGNQRQIMKDDLIQYLDEKGLIEWDVDLFGNYIRFSDDMMSSITTKGLLSKWSSNIYAKVKYSLKLYYGCGFTNRDVVEKQFDSTCNMVDMLLPVLQDLVNDRIHGMEDIFIAVYGVDSDEVYAYRKFLQLCKTRKDWNENYMWNDYRYDGRLRDIVI